MPASQGPGGGVAASEADDFPAHLEDVYEVGPTLGTGGFSIVRGGVDRATGDKVAVKTLKKGAPGSVTASLVENEVMVMNHIVENVLPHPNVINLVDVFEDNGQVHLVLELCEGGELFDRIVQQERYSEAAAARVVQQIANGLASLHKAGIVHRDLKPENCLFLGKDEMSELKIMDFGLSSIDGVTNSAIGLFGSIDYVSPEGLLRQPVQAPGDMWALGVILYILLSGYPPFHAITQRQKQELILSGSFDFDVPTWKTISGPAKALICDLLSVDLHLRPTAAELLMHPWVRGDAARQERVDPEIHRRLLSFNARRKIRAAAFAAVVSSKLMLRTRSLKKLVGGGALSEEELAELAGHMRRLSSNGGKSVSLPELEQVLSAMHLGGLAALAPRIFELFDADGDGAVDMRELVCGLSTLRGSGGTDDALLLCFKMYDADNSGCITKDELADMLRALPEEFLPPDFMEPGKLDEVFERMDANCDGQISFAEFREALRADRSLLEAVFASTRGPKLSRMHSRTDSTT